MLQRFLQGVYSLTEYILRPVLGVSHTGADVSSPLKSSLDERALGIGTGRLPSPGQPGMAAFGEQAKGTSSRYA